MEWKDGVGTWKYTENKYSVTKVWNEIRQKENKVSWHRLLWSNFVIHRHAVIVWMALLNRLPTLDRMVAWGLNVSRTCRFCQQAMETRNHLFFGCSYSKEVWKAVLQLCGLQRDVHDWSTELNWAIKKLKGRSLLTIILRVAWRAFLYCIWRERNQRICRQRVGTVSSIVEQIKSIVRIKLSKMHNVTGELVNRSLCQHWGLNIF